MGGTRRGVEGIYPQTGMNTCGNAALAKSCMTETSITAADLFNEHAQPFDVSQALPVLRILSDRDTEYGGRVDSYDCRSYRAANDVDHGNARVGSPQATESASVLATRCFWRSAR